MNAPVWRIYYRQAEHGYYVDLTEFGFGKSHPIGCNAAADANRIVAAAKKVLENLQASRRRQAAKGTA